MTKDEVLQKVNDYCGEKSYTSETLTDEFKEKFADFFAKKYPETNVDDESAIADLQFNLNTAFSATSKGITEKAKSFHAKETEYKRQIEELNKKIGQTNPPTQTVNQVVDLPQDVKNQLAELEAFKNEARKNNKFKEVVSLAKKSVRSDLHKSLENYAEDFEVNVDDDAKEQAKKLTARFQEIFKDSIGDIKPLAPKQTAKRDEEFLASVKKVKI